MAWTFVRPADPALLSARPLLDLGTGDGQTLSALASGEGLVVGLDRSIDVLRAARMAGIEHLVGGDASAAPFPNRIFATVLAGDLFHHLTDDVLSAVLHEIRRVARRDARLVAWWYADPPHRAPDAPAFPRSYAETARIVERAGFTAIEPMDLAVALAAGPVTLGITAVRG